MPDVKRRSQLYSWSVTAGIACALSLVLLFAAKAAQREARFMDLVRPACEHLGITNEELHRLVRSQYKPGARKLEALHAVVLLCRDGTKAGGRARSALTDV